MRRGEKFSPLALFRPSRERMSSRMLSNGSPMPMNTILRSMGHSGLSSPRCARATSICPRISAMVMLRSKPICPVEQKVQAMAQPTCEDTHCVQRRTPSRESEGISTVSTRAPSSSRSRNFVVSSWLFSTVTTSGQTMTALAVSFSRQSFEILVMDSKSRTMRCHSHCQICMARNLRSPSSV